MDGCHAAGYRPHDLMSGAGSQGHFLLRHLPQCVKPTEAGQDDSVGQFCMAWVRIKPLPSSRSNRLHTEQRQRHDAFDTEGGREDSRTLAIIQTATMASVKSLA